MELENHIKVGMVLLGDLVEETRSLKTDSLLGSIAKNPEICWCPHCKKGFNAHRPGINCLAKVLFCPFCGRRYKRDYYICEYQE